MNYRYRRNKRFGNTELVDVDTLSDSEWTRLKFTASQDSVPVILRGVAVSSTTLKENNFKAGSKVSLSSHT